MTDQNWYGNVFKTWQAKQLGPKPTAEMLATVHNLGARPGKQALAIAMGLRECGVTGSQIVIACGAQQLNKMRGYVVDALLKREAAPPSAVGHTVYKLALTAKGQKRVDTAVKRAADLEAAGKADEAEKPVKGKRAVKAARKAKVKAAVNEPLATGNADNVATINEPTVDNQPQA